MEINKNNHSPCRLKKKTARGIFFKTKPTWLKRMMIIKMNIKKC